MKNVTPLVLTFLVAIAVSACSEETASTPVEPEVSAVETLQTKLANPSRAQADRDRDSGRRPAEVLDFLGIGEGQTVIDLMAAGGYYTEVLSLAVGADGKVYAQNPQFVLQFNEGSNDIALTARLADNRLLNTERLDTEFSNLGVEAGSVDGIVTALNFHDVHQYELGVDVMVTAIFTALKPGGVVGVIDHAGDADKDNPSMHRVDEQIVRDVFINAGFVLADSSDLLRNPEDDRAKSVFAPEIRGHTDRFLLKFEKPN